MTNLPDQPLVGTATAARRRTDPLVHVAGTALLMYAFLVAVPLVSGLPAWAAVYGTSLAVTLFTVVLMGAGALWRTPPLEEGLLAVSLLTAWVLASKLPGISDHAWLYLGPAAEVLFVLGCLFTGKLLSRIVRERNMALPVVVVAALADVFTVFWGPTGQALAKAPELVKRLSMAIPRAGSAVGPEGAGGLSHVATMGIGDFIFLALFLALATRFEFPTRRTMVAILCTASAGIVLALSIPVQLAGMPLLPYMSLGFIAANFREFRLTAQERRDLLIALATVLVLFGVVALALRL